jgi:uncharacterized protein (DUF3820 family)
MANELTDHSLMPFGKYKNKKMMEVPAKYLLWLFEKGCSDFAVKTYIHNNLQGLKQEAAKTSKSWRR